MTVEPTRHGLLRRFLWPTWAERKRMLLREARLLVAAAYVLAAFAYLLPPRFDDPSTAYAAVAWAAMLVRTLQYHGGILLLAVAGIAAARRRWRLAAAAAVPALLAVVPPWLPAFPPNGVRPTLRVVSANLLMINRDTAGILAEIREAVPDVVLLQEYSAHWHQAVAPALGRDHPHAAFDVREDSFGIAIYSRLPFVGPVERRLSMGEWEAPQMRAVVTDGGRELALYNIHLMPPRRLDYVVEHRREFADLLRHLERERLPVVIGGDFNFTETTSQASELRRRGFRDAQDVAGHGRGATWPVNGWLRYVPGIRLDHVYLGPGLTTSEVRIGTGRGSDHRPIVVDVAWE